MSFLTVFPFKIHSVNRTALFDNCFIEKKRFQSSHSESPLSDGFHTQFPFLFLLLIKTAAVIVDKLTANIEITRTCPCCCSWSVICFAIRKTTCSPQFNKKNGNSFSQSGVLLFCGRFLHVCVSTWRNQHISKGRSTFLKQQTKQIEYKLICVIHFCNVFFFQTLPK